MSQTTSYLVDSMAPAVGVAVKRPRNPRIEVLRLVAIVGIAIFHTFLPWYNAMVSGSAEGLGAAFSQSGMALFSLGIINLLGSMGNHIFYMISGFYLLPRMAADSRYPGFWERQYFQVVRRVGVIIVSVALYAAIVLGLNAWVVEIPGVAPMSISWWILSLEFVWLYLLFVAVAPVCAWVQEHFPQTWTVALVVAFLSVFALNCYISFFAQPVAGSVGLLDWRKWMSGATYFVGFLLAGFVGSRWDYFRRVGGSLLFGMCFMLIVAVASLALSHDADLMGTLAYKSTSILTFLLAGGAVIWVMSKNVERVLPGKEPRSAILARASAAGILGFYIVQSLLGGVWQGNVQPLLTSILGQVDFESGVPLWRFVAALFVGIVLSVLFTGFILLVDWLVRRPLLKVVRLSH